ncbi:hypothetical protein LWC33_16005 [Pseudonocardia sp. RS11V-5]|uniref:hypothetical protein n=1 Tax=Pseudonocardia terrae TaxID=2905831 RepID=UPI001E5F710E|nr:hypothetical protein [Pseudonocardia terrae]MCE3552954.1 hypothetical protein [Pseudonocardia terrae]
MSTTTTITAQPEGPEDDRRDGPDGPDASAARAVPAGNEPAPTRRTRAGSWAYALGGMDCYGYGLGYDYWTALHAATGGDDPRNREETTPGTGRAVALLIVGLVAAAAVTLGLIIALGGHAATSTAATSTAASTAATTTAGRTVPAGHEGVQVTPVHP